MMQKPVAEPPKLHKGRPLKDHQPGERATISVQMAAELKSRLQAAAIRSNRTLSQEAVRRLERSFDAEALHADAVALVAANVIEKASKQFGRTAGEIEARVAAEFADVSRAA